MMMRNLKKIYKKTIQKKWADGYGRYQILNYLDPKKGYITPQMVMGKRSIDSETRIWALLHFLSFPCMINAVCDMAERSLSILNPEHFQSEIALARKIIKTKRDRPKDLTGRKEDDNICDMANGLGDRHYHEESEVIAIIGYLGRVVNVDDADHVTYLIREVFPFEDEDRNQIRIIRKWLKKE